MDSDENHPNKDQKKSKGAKGGIERPDIEVVQNAIERCIHFGMTRNEIIKLLGFKIDPILIRIVWDVLKSENKEFFKGYYAKHYVCDQIAEHRKLVQLKNESDMESNSGAANNYIYNNSIQNSRRDSSVSRAFNCQYSAYSDLLCYSGYQIQSSSENILTQNRNFNNNRVDARPLSYYNCRGVSDLTREYQSQPMAMTNYYCSTDETMQSNKLYSVPDATMNCNATGQSNGMLTNQELVKVRGLSPQVWVPMRSSQPNFRQSLVTGMGSMETCTEPNSVVPQNVDHESDMVSGDPIESPVLAAEESNPTPSPEFDVESLLTDEVEEPNSATNMEVDSQLSVADVEEPNQIWNDNRQLSDTNGSPEENWYMSILEDKQPPIMENFDSNKWTYGMHSEMLLSVYNQS